VVAATQAAAGSAAAVVAQRTVEAATRSHSLPAATTRTHAHDSGEASVATVGVLLLLLLLDLLDPGEGGVLVYCYIVVHAPGPVAPQWACYLIDCYSSAMRISLPLGESHDFCRVVHHTRSGSAKLGRR
jgi:hypothetical protein